MKEEDVRIGMKVKLNGTGDDCVVLSEKDYRSMYGNVYTLKNIKTGKKITVNACDFKPYINISDVVYQSIADAINNFKELNKVLATLQEFAEKNRDAIEELTKKTEEKERIDEEIQKSFKLHVKKYGNDFSLFSCYKAGYLTGRESK